MTGVFSLTLHCQNNKKMMMKKIIILLAAVAITSSAVACDICGCGTGSSYIGILPEFNNRVLGLRYRYNSLHTHIGNGGTTTYLTTHEMYRVAEIWGGITVKKKLLLLTSLPFTFNQQVNQSQSKNKSGLGDMSITGYYQLLSKRSQVDSGKKLLVQSLWIGSGIKLPTGEYNNSDKSVTGNSTNLFQSGTGSLDYTLNMMYDIRLQDAGLNVAASYKVNSTNSNHYSYGNKFNSTAQLYYKWRIKNRITVAPNAGVMYESSLKDRDKGFTVDLSGGRLLAATTGAEIAYKKIAGGFSWQLPINQQLAGGFVKANNRAMLHLSFIL